MLTITLHGCTLRCIRQTNNTRGDGYHFLGLKSLVKSIGPLGQVHAANGCLLLEDEVWKWIVHEDPEHLSILQAHKNGLLPNWSTHNLDVADLGAHGPLPIAEHKITSSILQVLSCVTLRVTQ